MSRIGGCQRGAVCASMSFSLRNRVGETASAEGETEPSRAYRPSRLGHLANVNMASVDPTAESVRRCVIAARAVRRKDKVYSCPSGSRALLMSMTALKGGRLKAIVFDVDGELYRPTLLSRGAACCVPRSRTRRVVSRRPARSRFQLPVGGRISGGAIRSPSVAVVTPSQHWVFVMVARISEENGEVTGLRKL